MKIQPLRSKNISLMLILFISITAFNITEKVYAHEYYEIKLKIHVVNPVTITPEEIEENLLDLNDIFAQCRIKFTLAMTGNIDGSGADVTSRTKLRDKMRNETQNTPFNGTGAGITIVDNLDGRDDKNGETELGDPKTPVVKEGSDGETWAHELAHGLGASHNGKDTDGNGNHDTFDPDEDGNFDTPQDLNNLMWPSRDHRLGNMLNEEQCKKLQEHAKKAGQSVYDAEQTKTSLDGDSYIEKTMDYVFDGRSESGIFPDLIYGSVFSIEPFYETTINWETDIIPNGPVDMDFILALDLDNDPSTGIEFSNVFGIDFVIDVWVEGSNFNDSNKWPTTYDYITDMGGDIQAIVEVGNRTMSLSSYTSISSIDEIPITSYLQLTVNNTLFDHTAAKVPAVMQISKAGAEDSANITIHTEPVKTARIYVDTLTVWEGYDLQITLENFPPNSDVELFNGDLLIKTVVTDDMGGATSTWNVPSWHLEQFRIGAFTPKGSSSIASSFIIIDVIPIPKITGSSPTSNTDQSNTTSRSQTEETTTAGLNYPVFLLVIGLFVVFGVNRKKKSELICSIYFY